MANKQMTGAPSQYSLGNVNGKHNEIFIRRTKTEKPRSSLGQDVKQLSLTHRLWSWSWFQHFGKPAVIYESETYRPCEKTGTPAIPLLGISPAEMCAKFTKNTCTRIFMAALNVTVPKQKAKYPSIVV